MTRRPMLVLWSATAAAVFLLGGTVATLKAVLAGGSRINLALLALSLTGLLGSLGVAGRIVMVVSRSVGPDRRLSTFLRQVSSGITVSWRCPPSAR